MNKNITKRDEDFAKWYNDVVREARLCRYSSTKGFLYIEENGFAIWESIQRGLDDLFKKSGHKNVYMPLLIPETLLNKEKQHVEGFAPEVAWVTMGGDSKLEEKLCIRPTSETLFCEYFKDSVKSYRDLPKLCNQWCSVVRWEKETRPFLRTREFLWQEGHTLHKTSEEAKEETLRMLNIYNDFIENYMAIPVITGEKTESEKFAGAEKTYTCEAMMHNGVALQLATSHYFGDKFSKAYDVKYLDENNKLSFPYQTSWGSSTRLIGALIMTHSDDNGLVLPPRIAPTKVSIIPIKCSNSYLDKIKELLDSHNTSYYVDDSNKGIGFKFAESEVKGIPLRIEVGKKEEEEKKVTLVRRDTLEKTSISLDDNFINNINNLMEDIQMSLYNKALENRLNKTVKTANIKEIEEISNKENHFFIASWCGNPDCESKMKEINSIKSRCIIGDASNEKCIICSNKAKYDVVWGNQY